MRAMFGSDPGAPQARPPGPARSVVCSMSPTPCSSPDGGSLLPDDDPWVSYARIAVEIRRPPRDLIVVGAAPAGEAASWPWSGAGAVACHDGLGPGRRAAGDRGEPASPGRTRTGAPHIGGDDARLDLGGIGFRPRNGLPGRGCGGVGDVGGGCPRPRRPVRAGGHLLLDAAPVGASSPAPVGAGSRSAGPSRSALRTRPPDHAVASPTVAGGRNAGHTKSDSDDSYATSTT